MKGRDMRVLNFKKPSRSIIITAIVLVVVLSAVFALYRIINAPLIEMQMVYVDNPAYWFKEMRLEWGDTTYYVSHVSNARLGREIGYATDEFSGWRIYEIRGHERDYLYAIENGNEDARRVMSIYPPEQPWRQYVLENATDRQKMERMMSVTLFDDGTAQLSTPPISSLAMVGPYYYSFTDGELLINDGNYMETARFEVVDEYTIIFRSATIHLYAEEGAWYVRQGD